MEHIYSILAHKSMISKRQFAIMENIFGMPICDKIKEARLRAGLTQSELGKKLGGVTHSNVSKWESGGLSPTPEMLGEIAKATSQRIGWFYDEPASEISPEIALDVIRDALTSERKRAEAAEAKVAELEKARVKPAQSWPKGLVADK